MTKTEFDKQFLISQQFLLFKVKNDIEKCNKLKLPMYQWAKYDLNSEFITHSIFRCQALLTMKVI